MSACIWFTKIDPETEKLFESNVAKPIERLVAVEKERLYFSPPMKISRVAKFR